MRELLFLISLLVTQLAIAQQFSGTFFDSGKFWNIRDVIAVRGDRGIEIFLTEGYFDRFAFAADGKIESRDLRQHNRARIEFDLKPDGSFRHLYSPGFSEQDPEREPVSGWQLGELSEHNIKARWNYGQSDFTLDIPIEASTETMLGTPITRDSAPAKALLAYLSARAKGDGKAALLLCRLPEDLSELSAAKRAEFIESVKDTRPFARTESAVSAGRILGNIAEVQFSGKRISGKPNARAFMVKVNDSWLVQGIDE
jgi:hypothetical protein